jgi:hypothetical protein
LGARTQGHGSRSTPHAAGLHQAYVKRGKDDAVDADACCEAMSRPGMRFVPIKSAEQQATLMLHKTRELLVKQRTMSTRFAVIFRNSTLSPRRESAASTSCSNWLRVIRRFRPSPERL